MRRRGRVDGNQSEIVKALIDIGATVVSLAPMGAGVPDLLVGFRNRNFLFELKIDDKAKLTPDEVAWHDKWFGQVACVTTIYEILKIIGAMK